MSRVLILGGLGMLGHRLAIELQQRHAVTVTIRGRADTLPHGYPAVGVIEETDLGAMTSLPELLERADCDVVVNAAGIIKHRMTPDTLSEAIAINAMLPQALARHCTKFGMRLIHFSTDCVFSGLRNSVRGADGYRLEDLTDARDTYGLSKLLGEPRHEGVLCLRTSLIGRELRGHHGLVDWYLKQSAPEVDGFRQALFNGLSTHVAARLVDLLIREHADLDGLWHVASAPISKFDFLGLLKARLPHTASIRPTDEPFCDRRLDGQAFALRTGWSAPPWDAMIDELLGQQGQ